jgi:hypothetical protein
MPFPVSSIRSQAVTKPKRVERVTASMSYRPFSIRRIALVCLPLRFLPVFTASDGFPFFVAKSCPSRKITSSAAREKLSLPELWFREASDRRLVIELRSRPPFTPVADWILRKNHRSYFFVSLAINKTFFSFHNKTLFIRSFFSRAFSTGEREKPRERRIAPRTRGKKRISDILRVSLSTD